MKWLAVVGIMTIIFLLAGCSREAPVVEPVVPAIQGAVVAPSPTAPSFQVYILGREGFGPSTLRAAPGSIVRFINNDPRGKDAVLTFQKDKSRSLFSSGIIKPKESWESAFADPGVYEYWIVGYGVRGRMVVE